MHTSRAISPAPPYALKKLILILLVYKVIGQSNLIEIFLSKSALAYL